MDAIEVKYLLTTLLSCSINIEINCLPVLQLSQERGSPYSMSHPMHPTHICVQSRVDEPRGKMHSYTMLSIIFC